MVFKLPRFGAIEVVSGLIVVETPVVEIVVMVEVGPGAKIKFIEFYFKNK